MPGLRLLKLVPGWVWLLAVLLGSNVYVGMQARHYAAELSASQARVARAEDRAAILLEHQRWQRKQIEARDIALSKRDERLQRDTEIITLVRQAAQQLERDDAETAAWADQPLPGAVRGWLRDLSTDAQADQHTAVRGDPGVPDQPAASP